MKDIRRMGIPDPRGANGAYCGPTALAIATGVNCPDAAARAINEVRRKPIATSVVGTWARELVAVLRGPWAHLRIEATHRPIPNMTFARWARSRTADARKATFIVQLTGHFIVVRGRKWYDQSAPNGDWISRYPKRRQRVQAVIELTRKETP